MQECLGHSANLLALPGVLDWSMGVYNPRVDITKDTTTLYASDAPADGRFLDTQSIRSLPKAPALSGSDEIPEMPQFETNVCSPCHNSNPLPKYW